MTIAFTGVHKPYGWLGNMSPHPVRWLGLDWPRAEHLFQALRLPEGHPSREMIRQTANPMIAKRLARAIPESQLRFPRLSEQDLESMRLVLRLKFAQHPDLAASLLSTGDTHLVEDCSSRPHGSGLFWGAKAAGNGGWIGENRLGRMLMDLRAELRLASAAAEAVVDLALETKERNRLAGVPR